MLVKKILDGDNPVVIWGSGKQRRSYIHASDCARMMISLVEKEYSKYPVNLGTRETVTVTELAEMICRIAKRTPKFEYDTSKPEGRFIKSAAMSRFYSVCPDFRFEVKLKDGLERMVNWYQRTFDKASTT